MLSVERLTKRYGRRTVVDDVSFTVAPGRVTGFVGPNGAGKSTTMRMMLALTTATRGRVRFDGRPYRDLTDPLRHVGAVLDADCLHPGRTARGHLRWMAAGNDIPAGRVEHTLEIVGLASAADRRVGTFSLGMRRRLCIAAALLGDPAVLVLDEPMNGLDPDGMRWFRRLLLDLAGEGRTVLLSSHLIGELARSADHLLVIGGGRLLADAPLREIAAAGPGSSGDLVESLEDAYEALVGATHDLVPQLPGAR
ncbi:MAG: ATP-binding cassette domain-containing protein [Thermoleophilia bacterium]